MARLILVSMIINCLKDNKPLKRKIKVPAWLRWKINWVVYKGMNKFRFIQIKIILNNWRIKESSFNRCQNFWKKNSDCDPKAIKSTNTTTGWFQKATNLIIESILIMKLSFIYKIKHKNNLNSTNLMHICKYWRCL